MMVTLAVMWKWPEMDEKENRPGDYCSDGDEDSSFIWAAKMASGETNTY